MKKNQAKSIKALGAIFSIVGLVFILAALIYYFATENIRNYPTVDARIVGIYQDNTVVTYEYEGLTYNYVKINYVQDSFRHNQLIKLYINPSNPLKCYYSMQLYLLPIIFVIMGILFFTPGIIFVITNKAFIKKKERLLSEGRRIIATVKEVRFTNISVNNMFQQIIIAEYGEMIYKSRPIYDRIDYDQKEKYIVYVYVNMEKPTDYYMDETSLRQSEY